MLNFLSSLRLRDSETDKRRKDGDLNYDRRSPIESDFGRVVFSSACRRLHDKTQVFPLTTNDNIHSRLTHSMEVMSLGKSFALNLCPRKEDSDFYKMFRDSNDDYFSFYRKIESLLSTVCLAHDIGNPPFGHFGETVIQNYFKSLIGSIKADIARNANNYNQYSCKILKDIFQEVDNRKARDKEAIKESIFKGISGFFNSNKVNDYTQFDGNAQGLRVLMRTQFLNDLNGLNLTYATLASFIKYPNANPADKNAETIGNHKHGIFHTELDDIRKVYSECFCHSFDENTTCFKRHPFAFLMEASDSICYLIMDMEDAVSKGWINYSMIRKLMYTNEKGKEIIDRAEKHFAANAPSKKKVVQFRVELMGYLVNLACSNFKNNLQEIVNGEYNKELIFDDKYNVANMLQKESVKNIYSNPEIESLELTGDAVLRGIMDYYVRFLFSPEKSYRLHAKDLISKAIFETTLQERLKWLGDSRDAWDVYDNFDPCNFTMEERFRIIRDFVSGMTDKFALTHYRKLSGQQI